MKLTQNQFHGPDAEKSNASKLAPGTNYFATDTGKNYIVSKDGLLIQSSLGTPATVNVVNTDDTLTNGIFSFVKKSADGTVDYLAKANGVLTVVESTSTNGITFYANAVKGSVEHTGGDIAFLNGNYCSTKSKGTGDVQALYGDYHAVHTTGTNVQNIGYFIGSTLAMYLDNPNANVDRLGALNAQLLFLEPTVINTEAYVALLDIDMATPNTGVTVDGDFSFLYIKSQAANGSGIPICTGTARAINSQTVLPSFFGGSIQTASELKQVTGTSTWTVNNGTIVHLDTDEEWGYKLNYEEGLSFTDGTGNNTGRTTILPGQAYFEGAVEIAGALNVGATAEHANNAAAIAAGLIVGTHYRTGDVLKIVH